MGQGSSSVLRQCDVTVKENYRAKALTGPWHSVPFIFPWTQDYRSSGRPSGRVGDPVGAEYATAMGGIVTVLGSKADSTAPKFSPGIRRCGGVLPQLALQARNRA